ncbi:T9SS type A sorting domain-containing protein [Fluviicola sp.]|uniref:T9SS type A sorting domain-containing protein n=1 Tax=Fluviicola sp. TaxID=1917219 RepID=UPI0031DEBA48
MKIFIFPVLLATSFLSYGQNHTPVPVTGYNYDIIAETTPALTTTDTTFNIANQVLYSQNYGSLFNSGTGLPDNGLITSGNSSYQLAAYNAKNCILLSTGQMDTLELTTPASYSSLSLLGLSTEGDGTILCIIEFTDGTVMILSQPNPTLADWMNGSGAVISGFDRTYRPGDLVDFNTSNPHLHRVDINLSCTDQAKLVRRVMIINSTASPTIKTAIFALSGAPVVGLSSISSHQDLNCNGDTDGFIQLTPSGLTPFNFSWNTNPPATTQNLNAVGAGNYTCTITDATGCTKQLSQILTEPAAIASSQTAVICNGEVFTVGSFTHTTPGTYSDTLTAFLGCDSVVTTTLTVTSITNNVTISGHLLSTNASGAQYQWLDCNAGNAAIPGATGQVFAPNNDGSYAVAVTMNNCTDTSSCVNYSVLGISETLKSTISGSPNPVTDILTINTEEAIHSADVIDLFGKKQVVTLSGKQLHMNALPAGIYFVTLTTGSGESNVLRIIKN